MMKKYIYFLLCLLLAPSCSGIHSKNEAQEKKHLDKTQEFRVMFYNVDNLFDTYDDPKKDDDEFLPNGERHWSNKRYYSHLRKTAQVINAIGEWGTPALCGLCEIENDTVLTHLLNRTPLKEQNYRYCITTGSDNRGINNALLYQRDKFKYLGHTSVKINFSKKKKRSRDILHVWGEIINGERLDVLVCHFPSRSAGEKETEQDRIDAAKCVRKICDSLYNKGKNPNIIIMGDFNDTPTDKSIQYITKATDKKHNIINLFANPRNLNFEGTHKYQGVWSQLDQMMISQNWNKFLKEGSPRIFNARFLLTDKNSRGEQRPRRNYNGMKYEGGFSDHLPIVADFLIPISK